MAETSGDERQALISLVVACNLAVDALGRLPAEADDRLSDDIRSICKRVQAQAERLDDGFTRRDAAGLSNQTDHAA